MGFDSKNLRDNLITCGLFNSCTLSVCLSFSLSLIPEFLSLPLALLTANCFTLFNIKCIVNVHICTRVKLFVSLAHRHAHTHSLSHSHTYSHTQTHPQTHTHRRTHKHTQSHTHSLSHTHTQSDTITSVLNHHQIFYRYSDAVRDAVATSMVVT